MISYLWHQEYKGIVSLDVKEKASDESNGSEDLSRGSYVCCCHISSEAQNWCFVFPQNSIDVSLKLNPMHCFKGSFNEGAAHLSQSNDNWTDDKWKEKYNKRPYALFSRSFGWRSTIFGVFVLNYLSHFLHRGHLCIYKSHKLKLVNSYENLMLLICKKYAPYIFCVAVF